MGPWGALAPLHRIRNEVKKSNIKEQSRDRCETRYDT
jgi:hypothetical protein